MRMCKTYARFHTLLREILRSERKSAQIQIIIVNLNSGFQNPISKHIIYSVIEQYFPFGQNATNGDLT